jgi:signal transduction histidine kinase
MLLREFLSEQRAAIATRTRSKVVAGHLPRPSGDRDSGGIPLFVEQLIEALGRSFDPTVASRAIGEGAARHGGELLRDGFTVAQVVHEYGAVCQTVAELASELSAPITADEFHTLNRCLDEAIACAVTEYARQREQLLVHAGQELLGELAHELRNALGSAMITFDILRAGNVGFSGSTAGVLAASLRRLAALMDSSLAGVRLESGVRVRERVPVSEFIEEIEIGATLEANARDVTLVVAPVERGVDVDVDRVLFASAVGNVLNNAFKFTRPRSHVSLKTRATADRVLIEIEDECGGLPPGKAEALFRPFVQGGPDRTGLGLGLSISRKSVEGDGGKLRVRDVPGVGCVFTIDMPRVAVGA